MSFLRDYMEKRQLTTELQQKVKRYYEYLHDESLANSEKGQEMIKNLEGKLKYDI